MPEREHQQHTIITEGERKQLEQVERIRLYLMLSTSQRIQKRDAYRNRPRTRHTYDA